MDLSGSVAVVTGASSGIGAETLAREGCAVALVARREDRLAEIAASTDGRTVVHPTDVSDVGLELLQMMENAGRTLARHVMSVDDGPAIVLAGTGGNGGGGLASARHLANHDVPVTIVLDREPDRLTGAAAHQYRILDAMGVPTVTGANALAKQPASGIFVDALVGYGLSGPLQGTTRLLVDTMNRRDEPVVCLDVPSGLDATHGATGGPFVRSARTVTLALPKTGLTGLEGSLYLGDIGIPRTVYDRLEIVYEPPSSEPPGWNSSRPTKRP